MSEEYNHAQRRFVLPPNATEVTLLRHGATVAAVEGAPFPLAGGHGDPPLSELGEAQAARACARLAEDPPSLIAVSGLVRTVRTAADLVAATGLEPLVVPDLREVHLGDWEAGEWRIRMARADPVAVRVLTEQRWDVIPGAESREQFGGRVRRGVEAVAAAAGLGARAVAVVHGGVIGELCHQATESRPFGFVHAENCSLTRLIVWQDGGLTLQGFNDVAHL